MQDSDNYYCFQLIEQGVAFPPMLVKAEVQSGNLHGGQSTSQCSSAHVLRLQAIRFLNGKQELVQRDLGGGDSDAFVHAVTGKKGLNRQMPSKECYDEVYERLRKRQFKYDYHKGDQTLKLLFDDVKNLDVSFDFSSEAKRSPATPHFVAAFEAACCFGKLMKSAQEASDQASEELKQKERELRQAERRANNLIADLSVEKQRFQRLLSSGGSSLEDALAPRGVGKSGRRTGSSFMEGSIMAHDPDSPRKKRKAADAVLLKAGRTAQKETKKGFIDSSSDEEEEGSNTRSGSKGIKDERSSSTETAGSSSGPVPRPTHERTSKDSKTAENRRAKVVEEPTLNARRSIRSARTHSSSAFVESDDESNEEEEEVARNSKKSPTSSSGKSKDKPGSNKADAGDSDTEKTATDSDNETAKGNSGKKRK